MHRPEVKTIVLALTLLLGCSIREIGTQLINAAPLYNWGLRNESHAALLPNSVETYDVDGESLEAGGGQCGPGGQRTHTPGHRPMPAMVHVHLVVPHEFGKPGSALEPTTHDYELKVKSVVPNEANFSGTLWIVVTDEGVHLEPETFAHRDEEAKRLGLQYEADLRRNKIDGRQ